MEEIWKDIPLLSRYQISSLGRVKSKQRITKCNKGFMNRKERLMTHQLRGKKGYEYACVRLRTDIGVTKTYSIHRLVAQAFIPNPENKPTVDHINRDRLDNRVENLRWATYTEQRGNQSSGEVSIYLISKDYTDLYFESQAAAARFLKTDVRNVNSALHGYSKTTHGYEVEYAY